MTDHSIPPLDIQLTPLANAMLRRHLLKCAEAGLPVTYNSLCKASVDEFRRIENTPAEAELEPLRQKFIEDEVMAAGPVVSQQLLEDDEFMGQFFCDRIVSFAVIHYLTTVLKEAGQ